MTNASILHDGFVARPYWWEAYMPGCEPLDEVPRTARVGIVGGGYCGLSAALELAKRGIDAVVLEAHELGHGASTRNGGAVSGGVNVGKSFTGRRFAAGEDMQARLLSDAADAFSLIDRLIAEHRIDCGWRKAGRFLGAATPKHYQALTTRVDMLNRAARSDCRMVPREAQHEEIASDYYYGGMVVERAGQLHPALFYKGLLDACRRHGVTLCKQAPVTRMARSGARWRLETPRGTIEVGDVVIATNGYTGVLTPSLRRRIVPVASHIIATEELPADLAASLIPQRRTISDTPRVLCYYCVSPDGRRMVFGGRPRFTDVGPETSAPALYRFMTDRFAQLAGFKVTHAWTGNVAFTLDALPHMGKRDGVHFALGCNGSGIAMMTYLGHRTALAIAGANDRCSYEELELPSHPLYSGRPWFLPLVGSYFRLRDRIDRALAR